MNYYYYYYHFYQHNKLSNMRNKRSTHCMCSLRCHLMANLPSSTINVTSSPNQSKRCMGYDSISLLSGSSILFLLRFVVFLPLTGVQRASQSFLHKHSHTSGQVLPVQCAWRPTSHNPGLSQRLTCRLDPQTLWPALKPRTKLPQTVADASVASGAPGLRCENKGKLWAVMTIHLAWWNMWRQ